MTKKVVLAYSGGLDTSVCVRWMIEEWGVEVVTLSADVGQEGTDWEATQARAIAAGATDARVVALQGMLISEIAYGEPRDIVLRDLNAALARIPNR